MKYWKSAVLVAALAVLALFTACSGTQETAPAQAPAPQAAAPEPAAEPTEGEVAEAGEVLYACSMGCEVVEEPGRCSKCGMDLEEVATADVSYACPMCDFSQDSAGTCEKCGMALTPKIKKHDHEG